ncbi:MAG: cytochrome c [Saprospiraceae bacterium]|nr:cytochrome c [Saprospiraceae bacterium]MCW5923883.1 cytochrome c [Saprospiraceae bacterium]
MKYALGAIVGIALFAWLFSVCSPAGINKTGHEYMPDMYHSVGYEANQYNAYSWNHWDGDKSVFTKAELSQPRGSVNGTIPRGYTAVHYGDASAIDVVRGKNAPNAIAAPVNGQVPFYYENTEDDRLRCEQEITTNPFPVTKSGLERGKALYDVQCAICHGEKGNGEGWLVTMPDSKYPAQPKNLVGPDMVEAKEGRFYFSIMYGKNVMGSYADKLSYEERWQVIHYIRSLQTK